MTGSAPLQAAVTGNRNVSCVALATADGMHHLYLVALTQQGRGVLAAWDDILIEFDRQAAPGKLQTLQQIGHRLAIRELVALAVQLNVHSARTIGKRVRILARSRRPTKAAAAPVHS